VALATNADRETTGLASFGKGFAQPAKAPEIEQRL